MIELIQRTAAIFVLGAVLLSAQSAVAQDDTEYAYDPALYSAMEWRNVGPHRGGRVTAVAGVPENPNLYYMGPVGGGIWRTINAGASWENISDEFFKTASVGAIAVSESDPNVIYVGMGEAPVRNVATSHGDGVYKSTDAGKTWKNVGLGDSRHISKICIHPNNPDIVYVAVQGHLHGPNDERGVYRSTDGGETWERVLYVNDTTGATDLSMDATNPRIFYAAMWDHQRLPWQVRSGPNSSMHKSTDGGDTWEKLTDGLPAQMGKLGVSVSPANPNRVYAVIEAEEGGIFRSDDGGKSWQHINRERVLIARAWYYMHIFADPTDENTVYVLSAPMMKSIDGGKSFTRIETPHGDNHDLWINPEHPNWMVEGNDGGANVSWDGGKTWSTQDNQATAQLYRVAIDRQFPFRLYAGQQDNSTVAIASRSFSGLIGHDDWYTVGGGESAHVAFDPDNPRLVYATTILGSITEYDRRTKMSRNIMPYPVFDIGADAKDMIYRANWNAPVVVSLHDTGTLYFATNKLLRSTDRGNHWTEVSPDLTRNEIEKQGRGGIPFTNEQAGAEVYNSIMYIAESPHEPGTIWVGTDDGLVHITRNGGEDWADVTPRGLDESIVNTIEVSLHDPATAYAAVMRYKFDDFLPYIYKTTNYGRSWQRLDDGLPDEAFVRVVREDRQRQGLLYAGTETGIHISFDDGDNWQPLQLNLPAVPITDLAISHTNDLVAATQGRAFWILDGIAPLQQINNALAGTEHYLFQPDNAYRHGNGGDQRDSVGGENPPNGAVIYTYFKDAPKPEETLVNLEILDATGTLVRQYTNREGGDAMCYADNQPGGEKEPYGVLKLEAGMNRLVWDHRRENIVCIPDFLLSAGWQGYRVAPGRYTVRLTVDDDISIQSFDVLDDPRLERPVSNLRPQQSRLASLYDRINENHREVRNIRSLRAQAQDRLRIAPNHAEIDSIREAVESLTAQLDEWLDSIIQTRIKTPQDQGGIPGRVNGKLIFLMRQIDAADTVPTGGMDRVHNDLTTQSRAAQAAYESLLSEDVAPFNARLDALGVPGIFVP